MLYDTEKSDIFVARDPIGIIPLYYGLTKDNEIMFAREAKGLTGDCVFITTFPPGNYLKISSKNGSGIYNVLLKIKKNILKKTENRENIYVSRERHRRIIEDSLENLEKSIKIKDIEIVAEEIRQSLKNLSKITGRNDIEDILDIIFNDFCIGK